MKEASGPFRRRLSTHASKIKNQLPSPPLLTKNRCVHLRPTGGGWEEQGEQKGTDLLHAVNMYSAEKKRRQKFARFPILPRPRKARIRNRRCMVNVPYARMYVLYTQAGTLHASGADAQPGFGRLLVILLGSFVCDRYVLGKNPVGGYSIRPTYYIFCGLSASGALPPIAESTLSFHATCSRKRRIEMWRLHQSSTL